MSNRRVDPRNRNGFTLIELLFTLSVTGVLAAASWPALTDFLARQELNTLISEFHSELNHSRLLAITTGKQVVMCPSVDQTGCSDVPRWDQGWLIFEDDNRDRERSPEERLVRARMSSKTAVTVTSSVYRRRIRFQPSGFAAGANLSVDFCQPGHETPSATLVVSNAGRPRRAETGGRTCPES